MEGRKKVVFDPSKKAYNDIELINVPKPHWALAFAGYILDYSKNRNCVALVERVKDCKPDRWALIPAGVSDNLCEIKHPEELIRRETYEELIIHEGENRIFLEEVEKDLLTSSQIEIVDAETNKKYHAKGELYPTCDSIFLAQAYHVKMNIDHLTFRDGESDSHGKLLHRKIALVDVKNLFGRVQSIETFECGNKLGKRKIDLTEGKSAPSLRWFRESSKIFLNKL